MFTLWIPIRTVSITNVREHWAVRHRRAKAQREAVRLIWQTVVKKRRVELPCVVILTRIAPGLLDSDNLPASMKSVRDEIADLLGVDDRDPCVAWHYRQERSKRGQYTVRVDIVSVESAAQPWASTAPEVRICFNRHQPRPGAHA